MYLITLDKKIDVFYDSSLNFFSQKFFPFFTGSTNSKEVEPPLRDEIENWEDTDFENSRGKYSPSAKTLVDKTAFAFEEEHPDMRIVIFNPSMILGNIFFL